MGKQVERLAGGGFIEAVKKSLESDYPGSDATGLTPGSWLCHRDFMNDIVSRNRMPRP